MHFFDIILRKQLRREAKATETEDRVALLEKSANLHFPPFPNLRLYPKGDKVLCRVSTVIASEDSHFIVCMGEPERLNYDKSFEDRLTEMKKSGWKEIANH